MKKRTKSLLLCLSSVGIVGTFAWQADSANPTCPQTSLATVHSGTFLTGDCPAGSSATTCTFKSGTTGSGTVVQLQNAGTSFKSTAVAITDKVSFAAVGDFNKDGWPDFVGTNITSVANTTAPTLTFLKVYVNQTWQNEGLATSSSTTYCSTASAPTNFCPGPDWTKPVTPKFVASMDLHTSPNKADYKGWNPVAVGDFNGDGWDDIFEMYVKDCTNNCSNTSGFPGKAGSWGFYSMINLYLNKAAPSTASPCVGAAPTGPVGGCPQFNTYYNAATQAAMATLLTSTLSLPRATASLQVIDYNGDGRLDILLGSGDANGTIHIFLGSCTAATPAAFNNGLVKCAAGNSVQFVDGGTLVTGLNMQAGTDIGSFKTHTEGSVPVFRYADFDGDNLKDLLVSSPDCCTTTTHRLRLFKGCGAASSTCSTTLLEKTASQSLLNAATTATGYDAQLPGASTVILAGDFTLDGKIDAILGTDSFGFGGAHGGAALMWTNATGSTPFPNTATQLTKHGSTAPDSGDYDVGFVFDFDKDPQQTSDVLLADGNDTNAYYVLDNRVSSTYVPCGYVTGIVDTSAITTTDAVITTAFMTPTFSTNGGTVTFEMSNDPLTVPDSSATWSPATGGPPTYSATFTKATGNTVRWRAKLCSNSTNTITPTISNVSAKYNYTVASENFRAGVVVNDGVTYVGAFRQPGDRGRFYALNAGLTTTIWEAGAKLDGMSDASRNIYTSLNGSAYPFTNANAAGSAAFRTLLNASTAASAQSVVDWVRSSRFGIGTGTSPLTKLGAIVSSSAAILSKPGLPNWYSYATSTERGYADAFVTAQGKPTPPTGTGRSPLVLFGSKDGLIHAVYTTPTNTADTKNGTEAWAYAPPTIVPKFITDYTAMTTANTTAQSSTGDGLNHPISNYYPDGSPTLVDYYNGSTVKTVALVGEGNGGRNFSVIDVTQTIDSAGGIVGPKPMWTATPGDTAAGYMQAKPVVARVSISGAERFIVIAATGIDTNDATKGRIVTGYDIADGSVLWQFQAKCAVTSELSAFETDDTLETGAPTVDGYVDRVVFADNCGYVYKINPAVSLGATGWVTGMGPITITGSKISPTSTTDQKALFSTVTTTGALGVNGDRPIAGTIGARIDSSTRIILYFGTGGLEAYDASKANHFYAVYADTGLIRSKYVGTCTTVSGITTCEKFYGGVVVTPTQVILTRTVDPVATISCDDGSTTIQAYQLNADTSNNFVNDFTQDIASSVLGALFGEADALYFATISGDVNRIGTPRVANAGGDSANNQTQGTGTGQNGGGPSDPASAFTLLGWRVVL